EPGLTTRPAGEAVPPLELDPAHEGTLLAVGAVRTATERREGAVIWRIASPMMRDGALEGVVQVEFSLLEIARLESRLRTIGGIFLVASIVLISFLLAVFLERRVGRPVTALVDGMRRAEAGELGARVSVPGGGEFGFLAGSFNRMLARLEDLTAGLESRVRRATGELADANRELKETNAKLWSAQLEVGRSERLAALGQMAATIAHELGTPLNSVLGYTQLLLREDLPAEQATKLAVIESQVQRMIETIRSVLGRTRDRAVGRGPVALAPLVSEALALVTTRLAGRALVLRSEIPPDLPPVPGDAAGHDRGRRARALPQRPRPADGDHRLRQRPRHVGGRDPARLRALLHDQGARARHGPRARHRGPHRARARWPGRDRVEPGRGHDDARASPPGGVMPRLLVVDDDSVTCRLLADVFKRDGYTVIGETDPQRALARAADEPVDLAILDVQMPEMDGLALLRGLRERLPDLPVVIMTAFGSIDTAVQAIASGAVDYLSKPMDVEEIRVTVRKALGRTAEAQAALPVAGEEL